MTDKLSLYNGALRKLGETKLDTLTEDTPSRYKLDEVYDDDFIDHVLEQGLWNFALQVVKITYEPSIEPDFGYPYAFEKPSDWIRTASLCSDEFFNAPLLDYQDQAGYWWANLQELYVQYVSNHADYGADFAKWPPSFTEFAEYELAKRSYKRIVGKDLKGFDEFKKEWKTARLEARSLDAMNQPTQFPAPSSWVRARGGRGRKDRGNRGQLIG